MQWATVHSLRWIEIAIVSSIMSLLCEVRYDISRIRGDRDRRREESLLPAAIFFIGKRHGTEKRSTESPQMPQAPSSIRGVSFVKPDAGNEAVFVGTEFQAEFRGGGGDVGWILRSRVRGPDLVCRDWWRRWGRSE